MKQLIPAKLPRNHLPATRSSVWSFGAFILVLMLVSACTQSGLAPGLTARMDVPGASIDRVEAFRLLNQFRATRGAGPLYENANLNTIAQTLAAQYATSGHQPAKPDIATKIMLSAGYTDFAETFSGWRNSAPDANAISNPDTTYAGLGVAYAPNSSYGVHWVLLLSTPDQVPPIEPDFAAQ